jgi:hypothetical protein
MNEDDHCIGMGRLWGKLQRLEGDLRFFLTQDNPSENYLSISRRAYFGPLVHKYNGQLSEDEQSLYSVDMNIVDIRNAIAHGRVVRKPPSTFHDGPIELIT